MSATSEDLTQLSTHLSNERRMADDWLESYLEDWAEWDAAPELVLASTTKTSLKVAEEMRPERLKNKPPAKGDMYVYPEGHDKAGKPLPAPIRWKIYELISMWKKGQESSDINIQTRTPNYEPHIRMSAINRVINQMHDEKPRLWAVINMRYRYGWGWQRVNNEIGLPRQTFYDRIKAAKKYIKKHLKKSE